MPKKKGLAKAGRKTHQGRPKAVRITFHKGGSIPVETCQLRELFAAVPIPGKPVGPTNRSPCDCVVVIHVYSFVRSFYPRISRIFRAFPTAKLEISLSFVECPPYGALLGRSFVTVF